MMTTMSITYNMPEDQIDFAQAHFAPDAWCALTDVDHIIRNHLKHGNPEDHGKILERTREIVLQARSRIDG